MLHSVLSKLHEVPIWVYVVMMAGSAALWATFVWLFKKCLFWKWVNAALLILSMIGVILITLVFRQDGVWEYSFIPFSSFELAKVYPDVYQEMMLNVIMFMPIGMTMPFVLRMAKHPVLITVLFALLLSISIELLQLFLHRGYAEIDDVIFNTSGTVIGSLSFAMYSEIKRLKSDKKRS